MHCRMCGYPLGPHLQNAIGSPSHLVVTTPNLSKHCQPSSGRGGEDELRGLDACCSALYSLLMFCRVLGIGLGVLFRKGIRMPICVVLGTESCLSLFLYGSSLYPFFPLDPSQVVEQALSAHLGLDLDPVLPSQTLLRSMDWRAKGFFFF